MKRINSRKLKKLLLGTLIPLGILLILLNTFYLIRYKPVLESRIHQWLDVETQGLYEIKFNTDQTRILWGKIVLENIQVEPNPVKLLALKNKGMAPCRLYHIRSGRVVVYLSNIPKALFWRKLDISLLKLEGLRMEIQMANNHCINQEKSSPNLLKNSSVLRSIFIQEMHCFHSSIQVYRETKGQEFPSFIGKEIHFTAESLGWNQSTPLNLLKILKESSFSVSINGARWWSPLGNFGVESSHLFYTNREGQLELSNIHGGNLDSLGNIPIHWKIYHPGINFSLNSVLLDHFNWPSLLLGESFGVDHIHISQGTIQILDEKKLNSLKVYRPMPQTWLKRVPMPIAIKSLSFQDIHIQYWDRNSAENQLGFLEFYPTEGDILNIHNKNQSSLDKEWIHIHMKSSLYGKGEFLADLGFNMASPSQAFNMHAEVHKLPLNSLNPMSYPLSGMKVQSGNLSQLSLEMDADSMSSTGEVHALYKNLRIKFMRDPSQTDPKKIKAMSKLANTFLILNNNPLLDQKERIAEFIYPRDPSRSVFNYIWKSLFSGVKPILGIIPGRENNIHLFIHELQNFKNWDQSTQAERRQNRLERKQRRTFRKLNKELNFRLDSRF